MNLKFLNLICLGCSHVVCVGFIQLTFRFETFNAQDWTKNLSRLCHTCKAIKPYRTSHCRACNRCVLAYDHHCPYVQNCIGFKNRPWFFLFVLSTTTLQLITGILAYLCFSRYGYDQYLLYPGVFIITLFGSMTAILTFGSVNIHQCEHLYSP